MAPGRRESQKRYDDTYSRLVYHYGEKCAICKRKIGDAYPKEITSKWKIGERIRSLQIDHINGRPEDDRFENKQLSCQACNLIKALQPNDSRRALGDAMQWAPNDGINRASAGGVDSERERERMGGLRQTIERKNWSLEALVSDRAKRALKDYIIGRLKETGKLEWQTALNEGACITDCSQQSIERYLKAWCSAPGFLRCEMDPDTLEKCVMLKVKPQEVK